VPSWLLRSCSLILVEREERKKRNAQVEGLKKNGRVLAGVDYLSESWVKVRRERSPLIGRPMREQNAKNKTGTRTSPGDSFKNKEE
jgi:hypothetical protein